MEGCPMAAPLYSNKGRSVAQERFIAGCYGGAVSPSSGASQKDAGDVRTEHQLIECKQTGQMHKPAKSHSLKLSELEKIADEAWAEGLDPAYAIRIYNPDSVLADKDGNIDLIVRRVQDDMVREEIYADSQSTKGTSSV